MPIRPIWAISGHTTNSSVSSSHPAPHGLVQAPAKTPHLAERRDHVRATAEGSGQVGRRSHRPKAEKDFFEVKESGRKLGNPSPWKPGIHGDCFRKNTCIFPDHPT